MTVSDPPRFSGRTGPALVLLGALALVAAGCGASSSRVEVIELDAPSLLPSVVPNPRTVPAAVLLPPGYHETAREFPVVYYLPGFDAGVTSYLDGSLDGLRLGDALDEAIGRGAAAPMIIVVVNGRNGLGGSFYVNSPVTGRAEDHLLDDVLPQIERRYRVSRSAAHRGIAGDGMGGFGALNLAMRHPDVFGAVFALNAALFDEHGLEDEGMLTAPFVTAWFIQRDRMRRWPRDEAGERMAAYARELYAADGRFATYRGYALAYAAAFAPDVDAGPPFADWPYSREDGRQRFDAAVADRLRDGIGAWPEKVAANRAAWAALGGIGLDVTPDDDNPWIPRGTRYLGDLLREAGIHVDLTEHDGGSPPGDLVAGAMLPFFSRTLAGAVAPAVVPPGEAHRD